jgi:hypothetical protein
MVHWARGLLALAAAAAITATAIAPANARSIRVHTIDLATLAEVYNGTPRQARAAIADYTVLVDVGDMPGEVRNIIDISGLAVLYFAKDGSLAAWSGRSGTVVGGSWFIGRQGKANTICIAFARGNGNAVCAAPESTDTTWIKQSTYGNVFGLAVGQAVPFAIPAGAGLAALAERIQ